MKLTFLLLSAILLGSCYTEVNEKKINNGKDVEDFFYGKILEEEYFTAEQDYIVKHDSLINLFRTWTHLLKRIEVQS